MFDKCEYVISAVRREQYPNLQNFSEFVFLGRSNVGKSSFINAIARRKSLAYTSSKPGKTQTLNFYLIDDAFYMVDVPGYGYASRSIKDRMYFGEMIEEYLLANPNLRMAFLLVDSRHEPSEDDKLMYKYLKYMHSPVTVIATKMDKVGKTHLAKQEKMIRQALQMAEDERLIMTSSEKRTNIDKVYEVIKPRIGV